MRREYDKRLQTTLNGADAQVQGQSRRDAARPAVCASRLGDDRRAVLRSDRAAGRHGLLPLEPDGRQPWMELPGELHRGVQSSAVGAVDSVHLGIHGDRHNLPAGARSGIGLDRPGELQVEQRAAHLLPAAERDGPGLRLPAVLCVVLPAGGAGDQDPELLRSHGGRRFGARHRPVRAVGHDHRHRLAILRLLHAAHDDRPAVHSG